MSSADLPRDLVSCETSLSEHNDAKTEIRGKHDKFAEAETAGDKLVQQNNYNKNEIQKCLEKLEKMEDEVSFLYFGWMNLYIYLYPAIHSSINPSIVV